ncbi:LasR-specific antiactivator QslA [Pseudomonas sp. BN606]|uniref:LasR-specific antiactivator QslA n=1 Tax=unclassified Pseudomonas TaxID=196821 RepID=UPI00129D6EEB|nr:LasR-specific antiactivator QslA [Pseudomonas sp. BN606]MDH4655547.1 hypothetical protein [Pseudomonas sp. BN606]MRK19951.1 hypothetical protein [Pseudomonas sp. JG-B]
MSRTAYFPLLSDFSEQLQEVNACSPPGDFRELGCYRLVQASAAVDSLLAALTPESRADGEPYLRYLQHLLLDAYQMIELSAQVAEEDQALLEALQRPISRRIPSTEHCRELPLVGWRWKHRQTVLAGMATAEACLAQGANATPWAALAEGRSQLRGERARAAFELGFMMRMYQRVMASNANHRE